MDSVSLEFRVLFLLFAFGIVGCSSTDGPEDVVSYRHDYTEEIVLPVEAGVAQLLVGTNVSWPSSVDTTTVFVDTAVSEPGVIRLNLQVVGFSYAPNDRALIDYRWRGDTLQVWCGVTPPYSWESHSGLDKTSYPPPWFMAKRVDARLPEGTRFHYLGRWFE